MADKPILFKPNMYRAIVDDLKWHTRRLPVVQPKYENCLPADAIPGEIAVYQGDFWRCSKYSKNQPDAIKWRMVKPKYQKGDLIYVKETFQITHGYENWTIDQEYLQGYFKYDNVPFDCPVTHEEYDKWEKWTKPYDSKSPMFMFKSLARLWLNTTDVRIERLQDITTEDAIAEGIPEDSWDCKVEAFEKLWDSINGEKEGCSWADNPWVTVIEFRKAEK